MRILTREAAIKINIALRRSLRKNDPRPLFIAVLLAFVKPYLSKYKGQQTAAHMKRLVEDCRSHVERLMDHTRHASRAPGAPDVIRNTTTLHARLNAPDVQEVEEAIRAILVILWKAIEHELPPALLEASLAEVEYVVKHKASAGKGKKWHAFHWVIRSGKKGTEGRQCLRLSVACLQVPYCKIKVPIWFSLETEREKKSGETFQRAPNPGKIVADFFAFLEENDLRPRFIYMDKRFCNYETLNLFVDFKKRMSNRNWAIDVQVPAPRWNSHDPDPMVPADWRDHLRKKHSRNIQKRRVHVGQLVAEGHDIARTRMTRHPSWKFTTFDGAQPGDPFVPPGVFLNVVNVPDADIDNKDATYLHADGSRSFATWTTFRITPATSYDRIHGYRRRNNIESVNQMFSQRLDIMRSPDIRLRLMSYGIGLALLAIWALFRLRESNARGRYAQGYSFTHFLDLLSPDLALAWLASLDVTD